MNHQNKCIMCGTTLLALALAAPAAAAPGHPGNPTTPALAQTGAETSSPWFGAARTGAVLGGARPARAAARLQLASTADENHLAERYDDAHVRGSDGKDLGKVRDFLVDMKAGTLCYAVVASGGWLGIGNHMHLVPFSALTPDGEKNFTVALSAAQWKQAPTFNEDPFEEGRVTVTPDLDHRVAQAFHTQPMRHGRAPLLRVAKLRGQDLLADGRNIGTIDGVLVQPGQREALALVDPHDDFVGGEQKYLVPVTRLQIRGAGNGNAITTLTKADFRAATRRADSLPTGFSSAEQTPSGNPLLVGEARAIRQALDRSAATSGADVRVVPRRNRIVLLGTVPDEAARNAVEQVVSKAAPQALITDELKVLSK